MPETAEEHPRHVLARAGPHQATAQDAGLQALARPIKAEDGRRALGLLRAMADVASPNVADVTDWGHANGSLWLRNAEADGKAFEYTKDQLFGAAAFNAADFHVSRKFELRSKAKRLFNVLIAANTQLLGWWRGR